MTFSGTEVRLAGLQFSTILLPVLLVDLPACSHPRHPWLARAAGKMGSASVGASVGSLPLPPHPLSGSHPVPETCAGLSGIAAHLDYVGFILFSVPVFQVRRLGTWRPTIKN